MPSVIDQIRSPYGLSGGKILSGSISASVDAFWYYPVTTSAATITFSNLAGVTVATTFSAGVGVYGAITAVSQSSGLAIVYSGSYIGGTPGS